MDKNADEALKIAALTLEKYRKNKTMVSPEDLQGKYKIPFQKLKEQLKGEIEDYLKAFCLSDIRIKESDCQDIVAAIDKSFVDNQIGKKVGRAVFKEFDIEAVKQIAKEHRERILKIYEPYFQSHVCLYTYGQCYAEENTAYPLIYNDLVDKFWDEESGSWIDREKPPGDAILIFLKGDRQRENVG